MKIVYESLDQLFEYSEGLIKKVTEKYKKENPDLTDVQIKYYIDMFDKYKGKDVIKEKDITKYTFKDLEHLIDSNFSKAASSIDKDKPIDSESIYAKDGLTIYEGDTREKCIRYGKGYSWCISRYDSSNMFNTYRYRYDEINFYFIFDSERTDQNRALVLLVDKNDKYYLANASNSGDFAGNKEYSWSDIVRFQPKIKDLKSLFKSKPLTNEERKTHTLIKNKVSYVNLMTKFKTYDVVESYISYGHLLTDEQFINIPYELKRKYMNLGHEFTTKQIELLKPIDVNRYLEIHTDNRGNLFLRNLTTLPEGFKFPETINGGLALSSLTTLPEGIKFPETINGGLALSSLTTLPKDVKFPETINGGLFLSSLITLPKGFKFPETINGDLNLMSLTTLPKGFKFPETINGDLDLSSLTTLPEGFKFPETIEGNLYLSSLTTLPKELIFPETINGWLYLYHCRRIPQYIKDKYRVIE